MDFFTNLEFKALFFFQKYKIIRHQMLFFPEETLRNLTEKDKQNLFGYALREKDHTIAYPLFPYVSPEKRKEFLIKNNGVIPEDYYAEEFYVDYLNAAIETNNFNLLYPLAITSDNNPDKYAHYIDQIRNYLRFQEMNSHIVEIASLRNFSNLELEERILATRNLDFIRQYLKNTLNSKFFSKALRIFLNPEDIEALLEVAYKCENFEHIYLEFIKSNTTTKEEIANYLNLLLPLLNKIPNKNVIIEEMLNQNIPLNIMELMKLLSAEEQEIYAKKALKEDNTALILTLAWTTDCRLTPNLIDKILKNNDLNQTTFLIANLNSQYLNYALNKLIKSYNPRYFLNILNNLYLFGLNSHNLLEMINFLFANNLEGLFDKVTIKNITTFKKDFERKLVK